METVSRCTPNAHLVVIGNGMASHRLIETLLRHPARPTRITVIGEEPVPAYNRILLSPRLAGELEQQALTLQDPEALARQGVTLRLGQRVAQIDRQRQRVITHSGDALSYDRLVIATGSRSAMPDLPGVALRGVHGFRTLEDVAILEAIAQRGGHVVVVGGGLLGLEAADGLRKRGGPALRVSLLQRSERLMNRQLDTTAAKLLEATLRERGMTFHTGVTLTGLQDDGQGQVCAVTLANGRQLPADHVIMAAGVCPNSALGQQAGLACERAILVDGHLTTSDPHIFALGECCQFEQHTYGLVEPIWRQVEVLAAVLCGETPAHYAEAPTATKLKVSGVQLYAFGPTEAEPHHDTLHYLDPENGDYCRLLMHQGRLEGAILYGDTRHGPWYFEQALAATDLTACRHLLLFGAADAQAVLASHASSSFSHREAA